MRWLTLITLGSALAAGLLLEGGVWPRQWDWCALAVAAVAIANWSRRRAGDAFPRDRWTTGLAVAFLLWAAFQMAPLPGWFVSAISPMRAEIARAAGQTGWIPLSIAPARTFEWLLNVAPAVLTFLLAREMISSWPEQPWLPTAPLLLLTTLEGILGLVQFYLARLSPGAAASSRGTFVNRNHFAGFLEMGLPLALAAALAAWRRAPNRYTSSASQGLKTAGMLAVSTILLLATICSLSRMGFFAALFGSLVVAVLALIATYEKSPRAVTRWRRLLPAAAVVLVVALAFVFLPTDELINRLASFAATENLNQDTRAEIWRETGHLIAAYPVTGSGLGAYESAFNRYKNVAPMNTVNFAHNDYLQTLAELGLIGFLIGIALVSITVSRALRVALWEKGAPHWELALGLSGAIAAILLHSLVNFNLYIPTNAMTIAWICGLAVSAPSASPR